MKSLLNLTWFMMLKIKKSKIVYRLPIRKITKQAGAIVFFGANFYNSPHQSAHIKLTCYDDDKDFRRT